MEHSVEALTPLTLCMFPRAKLWDLYARFPSLAFDITWLAAREEQVIDENLVSVGRRSALERTAYLLLHLFVRAEEVGLTRGNSIAVSVHPAASRRHARHVAGAHQQDLETADRDQGDPLEGPRVRGARPRGFDAHRRGFDDQAAAAAVHLSDGAAFEGPDKLLSGLAMMASTTTGLANVRAEIARACRDAGRDPAEVTLIAVSKTFGADAIEPAIEAGQRVFGENRVQEAKAKWPPLLEKHTGLELHLIGPLQSNKAKEAVALFDAIHSVDRPSLCEALAKEIAKQKPSAGFVRRDQYRRRGAKSRRAAAGRRRLSRRLPRQIRARRLRG